MSPGDCPALDCTSTRPSSGYDYDHLGVARCFCAQHARELEGVRERIAALLAQLAGLNLVRETMKCYGGTEYHELYLVSDCTMREQGALLVQLIKRERELTGAVGKG